MKNKIDQRQRILDMAADMFFAHGYTRVTMDELARELGMSKKTLYTHFPAKEDLLRQVVDHLVQSVIAEQEGILNDASLDFEARLSALLKLIAGVMSKISPPLMRDMQRAAPDVWAYIEQIRQKRINKVFGILIAAGQQQGYVRKDLDLSFVVMVMATTIRDILTPEVLFRLSVSPSDAFDTLRSILMGGILTDRGRQKFIRNGSDLHSRSATS